MEVCRLTGVRFTYPGGARPALDGVDLALEEGEFVTLCGPSGCGKTTLLRLLKPALSPHGALEGEITLLGRPAGELDGRAQTGIGFVLQCPEEQIVTDKVWHELAFGLESLGLPPEEIRLRVAEMAAFFGMEEWFHRDTHDLSGGEKQLLNLASVMVMRPRVLLLDEPTSQLDPVSAGRFLDCVARLNRETGTAVLLSEHRLEAALPLSHRCVVLRAGRVAAQGSPAQAAETLRAAGDPMARAMPAPMRVWAAAGGEGPCPVTVGEGRRWLAAYAGEHPLVPVPPRPAPAAGEEVLRGEELWFRYAPEGAPVLRGMTVSLRRGELCAVLGGNGGGKSTLLSVLAGLRRPQRGRVELLGRALAAGEDLSRLGLALLPQEPRALFAGRTVEEDLLEMTADRGEIARVAALCRLEGLLDRHPYDLSGGETQRAALAKVLLSQPKVLLLDEPTKGMDLPFQEELAEVLRRLLGEGMAILMVSHDVEFCARHAHRCVLLFDGCAAAEGPPRDFFRRSRFWTTAAARMAGETVPEAVTAEDLIVACGGREAGAPAPSPAEAPVPAPEAPVPGNGERSPRRCRRWAGAGVLALCALLALLSWQGVPALAGLAAGGLGPSLLYLALCAAGLALLGAGRAPAQLPRAETSRPAGDGLLTAAQLLAVAVTLAAGTAVLGDRKYYFISLLILLELLVPAFLRVERQGLEGRALAVLAVLCALAVAGRAAFFMLPQFKPVAAVTVVAGAAFGGRAGFLVGAASMLISNFLYVQGPWTPWQMAAMGLVGLGAGLVGRVTRRRWALCLYGFAGVILLYGGIMNPASMLMFQPDLSWEMVLSSWALGFPLDLVHGAATAFFLWCAGPPLLGKLDRLRVKYGI